MGDKRCMRDVDGADESSRLTSDEPDVLLQNAGVGTTVPADGLARPLGRDPDAEGDAREGGRLIEERVVEPCDAVIGDQGREDANELREEDRPCPGKGGTGGISPAAETIRMLVSEGLLVSLIVLIPSPSIFVELFHLGPFIFNVELPTEDVVSDCRLDMVGDSGVKL